MTEKNNDITESKATVDSASDASNKTDAKKAEKESDVNSLREILKKHHLDKSEQKVLEKVISLLETTKTRSMLPPQSIGDSIFKMYASDDEPTEFVVDRIEFDESGWKLVSYEKFGTSEVSFIFVENDYNKTFFDTAEKAKKYHKK